MAKVKPHKIYSDTIDPAALSQFYDALKEPYVVRGALMPDAHKGYSLPIGAVVATTDKIVPAWVGYDIGCGMCAIPTSFTAYDVRQNSKAIFDGIYRDIPVGFNHNKVETNNPVLEYLPMTDVTKAIFKKDGLLQLGSLGGGNHFIEIGIADDGIVWVIIHSGSRGIGHAIAKHYMTIASGGQRAKEGHYALDVNSQDGKDYITDMNFGLEFALENRREMMHRIEGIMTRCCSSPGHFDWARLINKNHNHAEFKDGTWVHRKGATQAEQDMFGVIPGNMRDGSFIVKGLGCSDSLSSSSHGAGRVLGRATAKVQLDMKEFKESMTDIQARVTEKTLDEAPGAYKNIFDVMDLQKDLVKVLYHVKPVINIKG